MKDVKILKFFDLFRPIFTMFKIDYPVMRKILQVKLIMDSRRIPTVLGSKNDNVKLDKNYFISSLWVYVMMGLFLIFVIIIGDNYMFQMSLIFIMVLFFISTAIVSDFSSVLLDLRDKYMILTKPVDPRTLTVAKTLHISIYLFFITISLLGPTLIVTLFKNGLLFFLIFFCEIILMDLFIIVLMTLFYLFILKFFNGEKLKEIINYVQIILTITVTVSYQFLSRFTQVLQIGEYIPRWWHYLIMPIWFGAPFELFVNRNNNQVFLIMSILVIVVPLLAFLLYLKLIPSFESNLDKLNHSTETVQKKNKNPYHLISRIMTKSKEERVFYRFTTNMIKNEREFKLKVYPVLGMSLVLPFIFLLNKAFVTDFKELPDSKFYLFLYFTALFAPLVVIMLSYSSKYKASWIYRVLPIPNVNLIKKAAFKASIIRLIVPVYILVSTIFLFLFKFKIIPDLIVIFMTMILLSLLSFKVFAKSLPFSEPFQNSKQSQQGTMIMFMFIIGIFVLFHFLFTLFDYGIYIYLVLISLLIIFLWKNTFNINKKRKKYE